MDLATLLIIMWVTVLIGICFIVKRLNTIEGKIDELKEEIKVLKNKKDYGCENKLKQKQF